MATDVDRQIARSAELLQRMSARHIQKRARAATRRVKRAARYAAISLSTIIAITIVWAIISPIGIGGVLLAALAMFAALILSVLFSGERPVPSARLAKTELLALPAATESWLDAQRRALPAPAIPILDRIGQRLEGLTPQLASVQPDGAAAVEVRTLLAEHLPELIQGYRAIPAELRQTERNGRIPDRQLIDGLSLIEAEISEMTEKLAHGDIDKLAIHGRYLELRYQETRELGGS